MVTELATKGHLISLLNNNTDIPWSTKLGMCQQIVCGLKYLHDKTLYHRDLKGENILIVPTGIYFLFFIFIFLFLFFILFFILFFY